MWKTKKHKQLLNDFEQALEHSRKVCNDEKYSIYQLFEARDEVDRTYDKLTSYLNSHMHKWIIGLFLFLISYLLGFL